MTATGSTRLARGSLTPEAIAESALALLDEEGPEALSMPRLGRRLRASSTAMYRHFASREDIIRAIGELLFTEMLDGFQPVSDDWQQTLRLLSRRLWQTYHLHPAAASLCFSVTTRGPAELRAADMCMQAMLAAGWEGERAAREYLAYSVFMLSLAGGWATYLTRSLRERAADEVAWSAPALPVRLSDYPGFATLAPHLGHLEPEDLFELQVERYLAAMAAAAPGGRPAPGGPAKA